MNMVITFIKKIIHALENVNDDRQSLIRFISKLPLNNSSSILEVGCGYGKNIKLLSNIGYNILGVEKNEVIVKINQQQGINCISVNDFDKTTDMFDVLIMSHLIEHFLPDDLLPFIEHYLKRLKPGGYFIIITPFNSYHFYDDFDHIKPYSPIGISMVFGGNNSQVKYYGQNSIELIDISFRKAPFKVVKYRGLYMGGQYHIRLFNLLCTVIFKITFKTFGICDGWTGLYRKR